MLFQYLLSFVLLIFINICSYSENFKKSDSFSVFKASTSSILSPVYNFAEKCSNNIKYNVYGLYYNMLSFGQKNLHSLVHSMTYQDILVITPKNRAIYKILFKEAQKAGKIEQYDKFIQDKKDFIKKSDEEAAEILFQDSRLKFLRNISCFGETIESIAWAMVDLKMIESYIQKCLAAYQYMKEHYNLSSDLSGAVHKPRMYIRDDHGISSDDNQKYVQDVLYGIEILSDDEKYKRFFTQYEEGYANAVKFGWLKYKYYFPIMMGIFN